MPLSYFRGRAVLLAVGAGAMLVATILVSAGWYVSGRVADVALEPNRNAPTPDVQVVALGGGTVTLRALPGKENWRKPGLWGLEWPGGYAHVGPVLETSGDREVVRPLVPIRGVLTTGTRARLDNSAFAGDPQTALGIPFADVAYRASAGEMPAWYVDGPLETWVIFVHGKGASREEALRILPVLSDVGLPTLVISYRNDVDAPGGQSGTYRYGETEWEEVEGAVAFALARGADSVVLVGYSMGGGIVASFLYRSELAPRVRAVVLDSPMLDFGAVADFGFVANGLPPFFKRTPKFFVSLRYGIDWGELDYVKRADQLDVPILLFHGDEDDIVPVSISDELAEKRPDLVTYERFAGAHHTGSWNVDPERYEGALSEFLTRLLPRRGVERPWARPKEGASRFTPSAPARREAPAVPAWRRSRSTHRGRWRRGHTSRCARTAAPSPHRRLPARRTGG